MGMTIEKAKDILTSEDFAGYSVSEILEARDMTLDIMRKYQEIKEYISIPSRYGTMAEDCQKLEYVRKVVEDGNDN